MYKRKRKKHEVYNQEGKWSSTQNKQNRYLPGDIGAFRLPPTRKMTTSNENFISLSKTNTQTSPTFKLLSANAFQPRRNLGAVFFCTPKTYFTGHVFSPFGTLRITSSDLFLRYIFSKLAGKD
ncbi:LOW QUALITY PROTEIN: hypothetical protein TorRG33x02_016720 [Trema orientale]|uniref:Uncharacterized protein n=1 Tax=Trema orientale TaxID=63057 RepID=A0A2P5FY19_TREOI|nr:LOW QUALITY PROTEIN: hypothetical protein TorRG33x02_016720 [Trema orientale]